MVKKIGYQGEAGANSHIACNIYDSDSSPIALKTFDEVFISLAIFSSGTLLGIEDCSHKS